MQTELQYSLDTEDEIQDREIERADLILARYGTLAEFLKEASLKQTHIECSAEVLQIAVG